MVIIHGKESIEKVRVRDGLRLRGENTNCIGPTLKPGINAGIFVSI